MRRLWNRLSVDAALGAQNEERLTYKRETCSVRDVHVSEINGL
jgi:hypothetical protein